MPLLFALEPLRIVALDNLRGAELALHLGDLDPEGVRFRFPPLCGELGGGKAACRFAVWIVCRGDCPRRGDWRGNRGEDLLVYEAPHDARLDPAHDG